MSIENQNVDLFVHREGTKPEHIRAGSQEQLIEALKRLGLDTAGSLHVFVGQPAATLESAANEDDIEDSHDAAEIARTLADLGIHRSGHVHCHRCHRIAATVHYNGREGRRKFSPAASIARVTAWARHRFRLSDADAEKLVLQLCNSTCQPRPDEHVGELVHDHDCRVCFDLVFAQRVGG